MGLQALVSLSLYRRRRVTASFGLANRSKLVNLRLGSFDSCLRHHSWRLLQIHRDRRREYADVLNRLEEYQSHVDRHRRDLGYESPHHDG